MKHFPLPVYLTILCFLTLNLFGQKEIEISNDSVTMSKGDQPAYFVEIPEANYENSLKNWRKLIRQNTKNKIEDKEHEMLIEGTQIDELYHNPINLYSAIIKGDSSLKLIAVFEIDSVFFDFDKVEKSVKNEKINSQILHFLRNFGTEQYMYAVEDEFSDEESKLKSLNTELEKMGKENESLLKDISENEQNIKNSEDALSNYELDNERKVNEINAKKEAISGLGSDPELLDQAKDQLKDIEKDKKNIESKLEKEKKNIIKCQANIDSLNLDVERNLEQQELKKQEIDNQELALEAVRKKLHAIK